MIEYIKSKKKISNTSWSLCKEYSCDQTRIGNNRIWDLIKKEKYFSEFICKRRGALLILTFFWQSFCLRTGMERNRTLTLYHKIVLLTFIWDIWASVIGRLKGQEKIKNLPWFFTFENCPSELVQLGPGGNMQTTWSNKVCCSCAQKSIKKICVKSRATLFYTEATLYDWKLWNMNHFTGTFLPDKYLFLYSKKQRKYSEV